MGVSSRDKRDVFYRLAKQEVSAHGKMTNPLGIPSQKCFQASAD